MAVYALTEHLNALDLSGHVQLIETLDHPSLSPASSLHRQRVRTESISSLSSIMHSDGRSTPSRPPRSPLRQVKAELLASFTDEVDSLHAEMSAIADKIYEIEELRHSPTLRTAHASRLDTLLSEVHEAIEFLRPRVAGLPTTPELSDFTIHLRKDWDRVLSQHALLKQEMLEDPWLIRFRTTAEQADGMMDPLHNSLVELTGYVGRILSSVSVSMNAQEGRLSIERLRYLAGVHDRLKRAYVPSIIRILNMMSKSVAERSITNGEALRRLNDQTTRWNSLHKHLCQLDAKVNLVLAQNDPDHPHLEEDQEMLDDDHMFLGSPRIPLVPKLEVPNTGPSSLAASFGNSLHRVMSAGHPPASYTHAPSSASISSLKPPPSRNATGSVTPNAQRTLRRSISRSALSSASVSLDRPRWNVSTKPVNERSNSPSNIMTPRRVSHASSQGSSLVTPSQRRPTSPGAMSSPPDMSRIPQRTPMKTQASSSALRTPGSGSRPPVVGMMTPHYVDSPGQRPAMGARTPSGGRAGSATPSGRPVMGSRTPSGGRLPMSASTSHISGILRSSISTKPSLAATHGRPPPSSWGTHSPAPAHGSSVSRASSRMSMSSVTMANVELQPFVPSKYDLLDQEVQKVIDAVQPGIFIGRIDQSLRRGQRKGEEAIWTGEFLFGAGARPTPVKLLELGSRMGPGSGKRVKCMIRVGGAWMDLGQFLTRKREEVSREEILDDEF